VKPFADGRPRSSEVGCGSCGCWRPPPTSTISGCPREIAWRNFEAIGQDNGASVNEQWRICFRFDTGDAYDVEIVDYH